MFLFFINFSLQFYQFFLFLFFFFCKLSSYFSNSFNNSILNTNFTFLFTIKCLNNIHLIKQYIFGPLFRNFPKFLHYKKILYLINKFKNLKFKWIELKFKPKSKRLRLNYIWQIWIKIDLKILIDNLETMSWKFNWFEKSIE